MLKFRFFLNHTQLKSITPKFQQTTYEYLNYIEKIIQKFDPSKAHGHGMISICMLKLCDDSLHRLVNLCVRSCIGSGQCSPKCKETNVLSVHIMSGKKLRKNYCPILLFTNGGNIF